MTEQYAKTNRAFRRATLARGIQEFAESSTVKSIAAILVGALALPAVYFESRPLKITAAAVGLILPVLHLCAIRVGRWFRRRVIRHVEEEGGRPRLNVGRRRSR